MFGWEFPPHISGGLGTACFGLSTALLDENVRLLFVVPKTHGDEQIRLINASDVNLTGHRQVSSIAGRYFTPNFEQIDAPVAMTPYLRGASSNPIEQWNWEFLAEEQTVSEASKGARYEFSGKYGPNLMKEVFRYAEVASAIAAKNEFDVIHAHDWLTFLAGIEAKSVSGKPLIVHVHATEFDRAGDKGNSTVIEIERKGMKEADRVIAVSEWTRDIIVTRYGVDARKVHVVHNGVAQQENAPVELVPKVGDRVVTFLGRITYQKGPQYFLEAARKVLRYFPDTHFIMAGSGDLLPAMIEMVSAMKWSSRIHFTGFLRGKQLSQVWSVTDLYVMPSVSEPFGITPLEAAHAGVPVIVSNQSGVAEVMEHAVKVNFWDSDALADAIINILRYKGLARSLSQNSREALPSLTWKRAAKKIKRLYYEC